MKEQKYIYSVIWKLGSEIENLAKLLNTENTNKLLANIIETDSLILVVWED